MSNYKVLDTLHWRAGWFRVPWVGGGCRSHCKKNKNQPNKHTMKKRLELRTVLKAPSKNKNAQGGPNGSSQGFVGRGKGVGIVGKGRMHGQGLILSGYGKML